MPLKGHLYLLVILYLNEKLKWSFNKTNKQLFTALRLRSPLLAGPFDYAQDLYNTKGTKIALRALLLIEINELRISKLRSPDALLCTMQLVS